MLKAKKKYSKKELKQDKFILTTLEAKSYIEEHAKPITYAVIGVLALIIIIVLYINSQESAEMDAANMMSTAQQALQSGQKENGISILSQIVEQYEGTSSAQQATFLLGKLYWENGEIASAKRYFKIYIDEYSANNFMGQAAMAGYADCLSRNGNYQEAAEYYERAANAYPSFPRTVAYLYSAAQAYQEAGNPEKAKSLAQKIINDYDDLQFKNKAEVLLNSLNL